MGSPPLLLPKSYSHGSHFQPWITRIEPIRGQLLELTLSLDTSYRVFSFLKTGGASKEPGGGRIARESF